MRTRRPSNDFIFDPSLVLYLPFWKLDGASFMSKDAYGHLATVIGALWTPQGRTFDGIDDNINCGTSTVLKFTTQKFTISAWVKVTSFTAGASSILMNGTENTAGYWFLLNDNGRISIRTYQAGAGQGTVSTANDVTTDVWCNIMAVRSGTSVTLYKNGSALTLTEIGVHLDPVAAAENCLIGIHVNLSSYPFRGTIGEVRLYNRALNPMEVQRNYLATKWRYA